MINRRLFETEHEIFRASVRKWVDAEILPHAEEWHNNGIVSREAWESAGANGFLCIWAKEKYGGAGIDDYRFDQILIEELSRASSGFYLPLHNRVVGPYLANLATDEQKDRFLPKCVSGEMILSIAVTEPDAGSDVAGIKSHAVDQGDHWVLNGSKTYISNGILSDLCIVAARTNPGNPHQLGLFLVEAGTEGYTKGRKLKKLGLKTQDTAELFFDNCKIPYDNVLGDPTRGFHNFMINLAEERLTGAATFVANAQHAFDITMEYINVRNAFGQPISAFQNTRFKMAEMRTQIDACQAFVDHCVLEHLEGNLSAELAAEAKLLCSETEGRVVDECLQLHGGAGYMDEFEISRLYADARVSRIFGGTSEILKEIISRSMGLTEIKR